jgi:serine/threonine protein kinase
VLISQAPEVNGLLRRFVSAPSKTYLLLDTSAPIGGPDQFASTRGEPHQILADSGKQGPDVGIIRRMPLASGQTFAAYTIIRLLGSGGMGEVYLAQHPRLPRRDALKLLPHDWSANAEYRARFNREADLASTLWHGP